MSDGRKPPSKDAVSCQTFGALAGIGGLLMFCSGLALKDHPAGLTCVSIGFVLMIGGSLLFVLGTILRVWK